MDVTGITTSSKLTFTFGMSSQVMPVRQAYARSALGASRYSGKLTGYNIEFTTINNVDLSDNSQETFYDSKVLIDDCVHIDAGADNAWSREVIVIDNETGTIQQQSLWDRSKLTSKVIWEVSTQSELWRVRRLLHSFKGSRISFFLPTFTEDIVLADQIGAGAQTMLVEDTGMTNYMQGRRPFGDIRLIKNDGTEYMRPVLGIAVDITGNEVISFDGVMDPSNPITPAQVKRIEWLNLVRIADDKATITHRFLQNARIEINVTTTRA
jgi:hypothetical protein